jgi:hypothetical protein
MLEPNEREVNKKSKTISLNPAIRLVESLNLMVGLRSDGNVKLSNLKLFGEPVPSIFNLGSLEENLISLGVRQKDFGRLITMTRSILQLIAVALQSLGGGWVIEGAPSTALRGATWVMKIKEMAFSKEA